jgi:hypothetical protein
MFRFVAGLLAALSVIFLAETAAAESVGADLPKEISIPPGHKLVHKAQARGVQIYRAMAGSSGKLEWVFEAPLADLFDEKGTKDGYHYEGPSWEAMDGSKVVRDKDAAVKSALGPNPIEDIPWLLIKVKAEEGKAGMFSAAVYIQRLQTRGGEAPNEAPKRAGTKVGVTYRAVYYFYAKAE